jgi:hypothetical protein
MARTTFDTKAFPQINAGNAEVVFWVVVWVQQADGSLMPEMPGHGLTSMPGTLKSLADVAEECQTDGNCYSNNLGFYRQLFYIDPLVAVKVPGPLSAANTLDITKVSLSASQVALGGHVIITAEVAASAGDAADLSVAFYDGDPKQGGRLFEQQSIPQISRFDPHQVQMMYRAKSCGVRQLFMVVNTGKPSEVVRRAQPLRVACPAGVQ